MDAQGNPIDASNWGGNYQLQGVLAPGVNILGAIPGGATAGRAGTSFATPIVSGIVALLLSIQMQRGEPPDPHAIRDAILQSALPCNQLNDLDSRRCLVGRLNIPGAYAFIIKGDTAMSDENLETTTIQPSRSHNAIEQRDPSELNRRVERPAPLPADTGVEAAQAVTSITGSPTLVAASTKASAAVTASECATCAGGGVIQLVYALGELDYDFGTQARRDSIQQAMNLTRPPLQQELLYYFSGENVDANPFSGNPHPWAAQSIIWTLSLDATPIYAISPSGPFAGVAYDRLRQFLGDADIERVSIPGHIAGRVMLLSGDVVPVIVPEVRGMYSWSVEALLDALMEPSTTDERKKELRSRVREVLDRIYYDFRNLGVTPQERALNYAATNALQMAGAISQEMINGRVMETIDVIQSPICRPGSECYDVRLRFFDPDNLQRARNVKRFTIDVSDVIPVTIGQMRSWSES
jgi:cyanobactin maturation PatA/PatG family protease